MRPAEWSLRTRAVLLTGGVLTVLLVTASAALVLALRTSLTASAVDAAQTRADELAVLVLEDRLPVPLPGTDDDVLVQVLGVDGGVLTATPALADSALDVPRPDPGDRQSYTGTDLAGIGTGPYRVVALGVGVPDGEVTVLVAVALEDVQETVGVAARLLAVATPLLVLLISGGAWLLLGRTLLPVALMTDQATRISGAGLNQRLPEPRRADELGRLALSLNAMLARLESSAQRQRRFIADASHELRSPVASLRTQLETAQPSDPELLPDLLAETVRLQELSEELLLIARLEAGRSVLRSTTVDLDDVVDTAVARAHVPAGVQLDDTGVAPVQVAGEAALLERVVDNLLTNALRHAERRVRVTTRAHGGGAELVVEDDGPGVPPADRERVLLPFTRLDDGRDRRSGGAGLGLAVVRDACAAHGGSVEMLTGGLGGALVRVLLPGPVPPPSAGRRPQGRLS